MKLKRNQIEETEHFIIEVLRNMNIDATLTTTVDGKHVMFEVSGDKIALLIGKRGQTLNALQYIVQLALNKNGEQYYRVTLDAEGYRKRRDRKSTRLNSSHVAISYAVFCLQKK